MTHVTCCTNNDAVTSTLAVNAEDSLTALRHISALKLTVFAFDTCLLLQLYGTQSVVTYRQSAADIEIAQNEQLVQLRIINIDSDEVCCILQSSVQLQLCTMSQMRNSLSLPLLLHKLMIAVCMLCVMHVPVVACIHVYMNSWHKQCLLCVSVFKATECLAGQCLHSASTVMYRQF
jgi:hypothetical protein